MGKEEFSLMKRKLLILLFFMCMVLTGLPAMKSEAQEGDSGGTSQALEDENPERTESVTAMDENGNITEVGDSDGSITEEGSSGSSGKLSAYARSVLALSDTVKVVNFNTKDNQVTNYVEDGTGAAGYTNGDYGADAAYLGTSGGKVKFMMSGVIGWVNASEVEVIDLSQAKVVSGYEVENGRLVHGIVYTMATPGYRSKLDNGPAPSYLSAGVKYYSYDGHYFYTSYGTMISDYQNNTRANSVNPDNPYYNYYQYLPMRSTTVYGADTLNAMISTRASSSSKMSGKGSAFVDSQNTYGVNALIMTGIAANESGWGTSSIARSKNNLFGLNAVDSSPGTSANTFASVETCISDFANGWMSRGYLYPNDSRYKGGFLGNKASGLNVSYASDPYWGEKAANVAYTLDETQGNQDYGRYTIGIKDTAAYSHQTVNVRQGSSTSTAVLYRTSSASCYAVLIKNTTPENGFYQIQSDAVLNGDRSAVVKGQGTYQFDSMYAYISADYVQIVGQGSTQEPAPEPVVLDSIAITAAPSKTVYTEGETFDPAGMSVQATWSDGTVSDVTGQISFPTDPLTTDMTEVTISYTSGDVTKTAACQIQVQEKVTVTQVLINPTQITLYPGEEKTFGVAVQGTGNPSQEAVWSLTGANSSSTVIDENGRLTVGDDETAETVTVKVQSAQDMNQYAEAVVTIAQKPAETPDTDTPNTETPDTDTPNTGTPDTDTPDTETPDTDTPNTDASGEDTGSVSFAETELKDQDTGLTVKGELSQGAAVSVKAVAQEEEQYGTLVKEAGNRQILGVYEVALDGQIKEGSQAALTFTVDEQYNGKEILILHYPKEGDVSFVERYVVPAEDGKVTVEVDSFSPFVLALNEETPEGSDESGTEPGTPENSGDSGTEVETPEGSDQSGKEEGTPEGSDESGNGGGTVSTESSESGSQAPSGSQNPGNSSQNGSSQTTQDGQNNNASDGSNSNVNNNSTAGSNTAVNNSGGTAAQNSNPANTTNTNTGTDHSRITAAPRTGDTSSVLTWMILAAVAIVAVIAVVVIKKRSK